jgi:hypothetical protein
MLMSFNNPLAMRILAERPDYSLFENNCQNFVKFLLEVICPNGPVPATIQMVLERMIDIKTSRQTLSLPGAYPPSIISTEGMSFVTASGTSWITASGDSWVTAVDYGSFRDTHRQSSEGSVVSGRYRSSRGSSIFQSWDEDVGPPWMDAIPEESGPTTAQSSRRGKRSSLFAWLRNKPREIPNSRALTVYKIVVLGCGGMLL